MAPGASHHTQGRRPRLPGNQRSSDRRNARKHGGQQPAVERDLVGEQGHRRLGARHQKAANAVGVEETWDGTTLGMTSNRPWGVDLLDALPELRGTQPMAATLSVDIGPPEKVSRSHSRQGALPR